MRSILVVCGLVVLALGFWAGVVVTTISYKKDPPPAPKPPTHINAVLPPEIQAYVDYWTQRGTDEYEERYRKAHTDLILKQGGTPKDE